MALLLGIVILSLGLSGHTQRINAIFQCSFETACLELVDGPQSNFTCPWQRQKGQPGKPNSGPLSDHTLQNTEGYYMFFDEEKCRAGESDGKGKGAVLISKDLIKNVKEDAQCLTFWYHMFGKSSALTASVKFEDIEIPRLEFLRFGNQRDRWWKAKVSIDNKDRKPYRLIFEAISLMSNPDFPGDVALDDITLQDGSCEGIIGFCDFEGNDNCGFTIKTGEKFAWVHTKAVQDTGDFAYRDHTYLSPEGHVMFVTGQDAATGAKTSLISAKQPAQKSGPQCITFWYQMFLTKSERKLSVYLSSSAAEELQDPAAWDVVSSFNGDWEYGAVTATSDKDYYYTFVAENGENSKFAIDDVQVIDGACGDQLSCDFEDGMCGWNDESGHYLFLAHDRWSARNNLTFSGSLTSQRVQVKRRASREWCFTFWYHMYMDSGVGDATLKLFLQTPENNTELVTVDTAQQNQWRKRVTDFVDSGQDFKLAFTGIMAGSDMDNAIALDDFKVVSTQCPSDDPDAVLKACSDGTQSVPRSQFCDQRKDCNDGSDEANCGSCTFESADAVCQYEFDKSSKEIFHWNMELNSQAYLIANFAQGKPRDSTYLKSPLLHETSATCRLEFYSFMQSSDPVDGGTLILRLKHLESTTTLAILEKVLFTEPPGTGEPKWKKHTVDIGRTSGEFHLEFQARKPAVEAATGYIAIDKIEMLNCGFTNLPVDTCKTGMSKCIATAKKSACVSDEQRCDFTDDCGHWEDEEPTVCLKTHKNRCDFDRDLCDWQVPQTVVGTALRWTRSNDRTPTPHSGPLRDHTSGSSTGGFIYLPSSPAALDVGRELTISSTKVFKPHRKEDKCSLRFYLHMYGTTLGTLKIHLKDNSGPGGRDLTDVYNKNEGDLWILKTVVLESAVPFKVVFKGTIGGNNGDIAIDDVSFSDNCQLYANPNDPTGKPPLITSPKPNDGQPTRVPQPGGTLIVHPSDLGGGAIAGIVLGTLAGVVLLCGLFLFLNRRSKTELTTDVVTPWSPAGYGGGSTLRGVTVGESNDSTRQEPPPDPTIQSNWEGLPDSNYPI